jgi:hypothetical protein
MRYSHIKDEYSDNDDRDKSDLIEYCESIFGSRNFELITTMPSAKRFNLP